ncbi:zinc transporter ZIP13 isoform X1 [Centruroides vittatus]|uniref:zinc transporter ZIP13 isoform X1 n=1 Tax=Centruroides vittatus TaxID=120091 RepID=UPI00350F6614
MNFIRDSVSQDTWYLKETLSLYLNSVWNLFGIEDDNSEFNWINGRYNTWIFSLIASCIVGLSGIVPLLVVTTECDSTIEHARGTKTLRLLLSFAVGGLLGDVFLHLLPEAWNHLQKSGSNHRTAYLTLGIWILLGIFTFVIVEIMFSLSQETSQENKEDSEEKKSNKELSVSHSLTNGNIKHCKSTNGVISNGCATKQSKSTTHSQDKSSLSSKPETIQVTGYLNLMANSIDNFTHGLAVSASFVVGTKMGILTTIAILMHEIPHEVGDFAILLRSGFNRWDAAKAQLSTAGVGIFGAVFALTVDSADTLGECTSWILPFTSGGFLNIALVNVLPEIVKDNDPWESLKQIGCLCSGIVIMALVTLITE